MQVGRSSHVVPVVLPAEAIWRGSHVSVLRTTLVTRLCKMSKIFA